MGLDSVREEILENARQQAKSVLAEARRESDRLLNDARAKANSIQQKEESETKKIIDNIKRQEIANAELEARKLILEARKEAIDSAFEQAREKIARLSDKKRESLIKRLLQKASGDIEVAHVYCNKKDSKFISGYEAGSIDMIGGLIAENKDKTVRVDYSFDTLLQSVKEKELQNISKMLFE